MSISSERTIVNYWKNDALTNPKISEKYLNFEWSDAEKVCWNCGEEKMLHICPIIPYSLKGTDTPNNQVLLCTECKSESPHVADYDYIWEWIKSNKKIDDSKSYEFNFALKEFQKKYNISFYERTKDIPRIEIVLRNEFIKIRPRSTRTSVSSCLFVLEQISKSLGTIPHLEYKPVNDQKPIPLPLSKPKVITSLKRVFILDSDDVLVEADICKNKIQEEEEIKIEKPKAKPRYVIGPHKKPGRKPNTTPKPELVSLNQKPDPSIKSASHYNHNFIPFEETQL
jgi:hypothetical protein